MAWVGPAIQAGASLLGGALSNSANKGMTRRQEQLQREFAQHGVRWRVEDAKAAGLHPLYALGAQTPSYSPTIVPDSMGPAVAEAGQNIGRAISAQQTQAEKVATGLQLKLLESQIGETDARKDYYRSLAHTGNQPGTQSFPYVDDGSSVQLESSPMPQGQVTVKAPEVFQESLGQDGVVAGMPPGYRKFNMGGFPVYLPTSSGDPAEALESITESLPLMWIVYKDNVQFQGQEWGNEFLRRYMPAQGAIRDLAKAGDILRNPGDTARLLKEAYKKWAYDAYGPGSGR